MATLVAEPGIRSENVPFPVGEMTSGAPEAEERSTSLPSSKVAAGYLFLMDLGTGGSQVVEKAVAKLQGKEGVRFARVRKLAAHALAITVTAGRSGQLLRGLEIGMEAVPSGLEQAGEYFEAQNAQLATPEQPIDLTQSVPVAAAEQAPGKLDDVRIEQGMGIFELAQEAGEAYGLDEKTATKYAHEIAFGDSEVVTTIHTDLMADSATGFENNEVEHSKSTRGTTIELGYIGDLNERDENAFLKFFNQKAEGDSPAEAPAEEQALTSSEKLATAIKSLDLRLVNSEVTLRDDNIIMIEAGGSHYSIPADKVLAADGSLDQQKFAKELDNLGLWLAPEGESMSSIVKKASPTTAPLPSKGAENEFHWAERIAVGGAAIMIAAGGISATTASIYHAAGLKMSDEGIRRRLAEIDKLPDGLTMGERMQRSVLRQILADRARRATTQP